jgi:recombination protein RecT
MSNLEVIKKNLLSPKSAEFFKSYLPVAAKHADEMAQRFAKMTYTAISSNPTLQSCSVPSILKAASQAASLDLDIDVRGLAYLVPYKNKGVMEAQFQVGYLGLIELAYRSGKVKAISANCIYESEKKDVIIERKDGRFNVIHPFSWEAPKGKMIAVYATAVVDGIEPQTVVMRADEIEKLRKSSKAPNSPAWANHYEAMAKKTAIRQLAKFLPKSIVEDFQRAVAIDEQETFVEAQHSAHEIIDSEAGSVEVGADVFDQQSEEPQEDDMPKAEFL